MEALGLVQVSELRQLCRDMKMGGSLQRCQKAEIIRSLFSHSQQHRPLFGAPSFITVVFKRCVNIRQQSFYKVLLVNASARGVFTGTIIHY